ncbi:VIN3-like protein 1 isoform X2 [Phragmites australis]|uniref:VIN3-like protein 1 isoform X2 n=1 Tax=Phragmites australis TaxID=29695 RepID=UPI002D78B14E|nr:VIN3-like protein 1 isoform X2 [Phragmites australis]
MPKTTPVKASKNIELQKQSAPNLTITNGNNSTKEVIKVEYPINDVKCISTWVCKNLACKAVIPSEDSFCKRCSCFICHKFDDNKDPSLWLVCASENDGRNCCGSSCHIECVLQHKRVGCFDLEQIIHLDGSYSCAACGKVSGILGYWKRQLVIGKDARRVDILCHRIYLSYRLLEGTSRFKELHEIIKDAKAKLESEVGPLDGMSAKMAHGIVSRSSAGIAVQKLCSIAIQRADEWLSSPDLHLQDSLPAACRFRFVDITSSSIVVILKETSSSDTIKGYKLWYWKSIEQPSVEDPVVLPKDERKILVFNLSPCTEYSFRVISFTNAGILGHSESRCRTGTKEVFVKRATQNAVGGGVQTQRRDRSQSFKSTGFNIRNIWKTFQEAWDEEGCFEGFCEDLHEGSCSRSTTDAEQLENSEQDQLSGACRKLRFNTSSVPDLNIEVPMPMDYTTEKDYDSKMGLVRSNYSGGSETCAGCQSAEPPAVESWPVGKIKSTHVDRCEQNGASAICCEKQLSGTTRQLDEDYEHCVKVIRQLECNGHIENDFRKKFLTWYSLRSAGQERRAVSTFVKTLFEEPSSLAEQLVDSFGEIVNCKKPRIGFCNKLWH